MAILAIALMHIMRLLNNCYLSQEDIMLTLISTKSINYYRERQNSVLSFLYNEKNSLFVVKTENTAFAIVLSEVI